MSMALFAAKIPIINWNPESMSTGKITCIKLKKMNIGKYIMVIAVAVITIGTVAFKGVEMVKTEVEKTTLAPVTFYHLGNGEYDRNRPEDTICEELTMLPCEIIYDEEADVEGVDTFERGTPSQPAGKNSESAEKGLWK